DAPVGQFNIGNVLNDLALPREAVEYYTRAVSLDPSFVDAHFGKASTLYAVKDFEAACTAYRNVLALRPDHCEAAYGLAMGLAELGQHEEAASWFRRAIALDPGKRDAYLALGNLLSMRVDHQDPSGLDEAIDCYRKVLVMKPDDAKSRARLGNMLLVQGKIDETLSEYRLALEYTPDLIDAHSCYLMSMQYHPAPQLSELYEESVKWYRKFAAPVPKITGHRNGREPERRLRIGYVSADFKRHPVGFHLMPVLQHHDAERFEVYCYSNEVRTDFYTDRMQSYVDNWRTIDGLDDEVVQNMIVDDKIDILVDLAGHTSGNRLLLFARRPAPVQVSWLGYFFSTGLAEIDYIIMDETAVLPGEERWFAEKVVRLPDTRFCYEPVPYAPEVAPLPAERNRYITFGSFNNLAKVTPQVVRLWARVLREIPDARLLIKSPAFHGAAAREHFQSLFAKEGIVPERLILRGQSEHIAMLGEYGDMDIALDPFPFNGGITTCEALWMGVPVLTLTGNRPIARQTTAFLRAVGMPEFIARSEDEYCELARRWAERIEALVEIRQQLRRKMRDSLLCDGKRFTANLESAYRQMWRAWCES
ncbi:MAG TPA: tetratricopeptide repeat protein, partial [Geobacteraceae bacterium]